MNTKGNSRRSVLRLFAVIGGLFFAGALCLGSRTAGGQSMGQARPSDPNGEAGKPNTFTTLKPSTSPTSYGQAGKRVSVIDSVNAAADVAAAQTQDGRGGVVLGGEEAVR